MLSRHYPWLGSLLFVLLLYCPAGAETLAGRLQQAMQGGNFIMPSEEEVNRATEYFVQLFRGEMTPALVKRWQTIGFLLEEKEYSSRTFLVLQEISTARTGRGFYLFAAKRSKDVALMIPHGFKDLVTDEIGRLFALEGDFAAIAWNTVPRTGWGKNKNDRDLTRISPSYFTAFTRAFARVNRSGKLIQVHGFMKSKRKTIEGSSADMILSTGTSVIRPDIIRLGDCLRAKTPYAVKIYPRDLSELGGTTNISAKVLLTLGHPGFINLELSRPVREWLRKDRSLRKILIGCMENTSRN